MIPNLTKGRGISGAITYCRGEGNDKLTGERKRSAAEAASRSEIIGGLNFGFEVKDDRTLDLARRIMEWMGKPENQAGKTRKCEKDCLHLTLSWEKGEDPSKAEMMKAATSALKALGMKDARAVILSHSDTDQRHIHIVASRISPLSGRAFSDTLDKSRIQAWALQWEREHGLVPEARRELHRLADMARARDIAGLLGALTSRNPTFTAKELERILIYGGLSETDVASFRDQVLKDGSVIALRERAEDRISRYTTRRVLAAERAIQQDARLIKDDHLHRIDAATVNEMARRFTLTAEQTDALKHCTRGDGFAIIAGEAGTGKSRTFAAIREAHTAAGFEVVGLSWTNEVVMDMRQAGFQRANTVAAELGVMPGLDPQKTPGGKWNTRTIVMVDEAAMLSTDAMAALMKRARETGAKLILAGDDQQLASIERGGMFTPLKWEHGAAELRDVMRVADKEQGRAFNLMHEGAFAPALEIFDRQGAIRFGATQAQAAQMLIEQYRADVAADPAKARFIFAATNDQVRHLNELARGLQRDAGRLGEDHRVETATGPKTFATGDRIQFTGNAPTRQGKAASFVNGTTGTVTGIAAEKDGRTRFTVAIDGKNRTVNFVVGDRKGEFNQINHGYAGTVFKGQGKTLDQTYVLHSSHWRAATSYVALTRHRDRVRIYTSKDVAADRDALAELMGRDDRKRAASGFVIDMPEAALPIGADFRSRVEPEQHARATAYLGQALRDLHERGTGRGLGDLAQDRGGGLDPDDGGWSR